MFLNIIFLCPSPYISTSLLLVMSFTEKSNLAVSLHVSQYYILITFTIHFYFIAHNLIRFPNMSIFPIPSLLTILTHYLFIKFKKNSVIKIYFSKSILHINIYIMTFILQHLSHYQLHYIIPS